MAISPHSREAKSRPSLDAGSSAKLTVPLSGHERLDVVLDRHVVTDQRRDRRSRSRRRPGGSHQLIVPSDQSLLAECSVGPSIEPVVDESFSLGAHHRTGDTGHVELQVALDVGVGTTVHAELVLASVVGVRVRLLDAGVGDRVEGQLRAAPRSSPCRSCPWCRHRDLVALAPCRPTMSRTRRTCRPATCGDSAEMVCGGAHDRLVRRAAQDRTFSSMFTSSPAGASRASGSTVSGSSRTVLMSFRPRESVAVTFSSMCDG